MSTDRTAHAAPQLMRFAYADPPYFGKCGKFYRHDHPDGRCWDDLATHELLIKQLQADYPDGWALSCSSPDLARFLPWCPDVRIGVWAKSFCIFKKGVRPAYAWEPVLYMGGRNKNHPPPVKGGQQTTPKDFIVEPVTLRRGLTGAKPERVCLWIADLLGHVGGLDTLDDLFPGTGAMTRALRKREQIPEPSPAAPGTLL